MIKQVIETKQEITVGMLPKSVMGNVVLALLTNICRSILCTGDIRFRDNLTPTNGLNHLGWVENHDKTLSLAILFSSGLFLVKFL